MQRALVIDDSRATRAILRRILTGLGFEVAEAADGLEGIQAVRDLDRCALVLIDWNMPGADGLQVVRALRAEPHPDRPYLVMVTTESETDRMVAALAAGADEYVMKPFTPEILQDKLVLIGAVAQPTGAGA